MVVAVMVVAIMVVAVMVIVAVIVEPDVLSVKMMLLWYKHCILMEMQETRLRGRPRKIRWDLA